MGFSRQEYWSGLPCPPPRDLPNQGSNPGLPYCRQILYHLSHQGSPKVKVSLLCPTLCDPGQNSPGQNTGVGSCSPLHGIFPTQGLSPSLLHCRGILYQLSHQGSPRILEWVAYPCPVDLPDPGIKLGSYALQEDFLPADLPGKFPYQGLNPGLLHCR